MQLQSFVTILFCSVIQMIDVLFTYMYTVILDDTFIYFMKLFPFFFTVEKKTINNVPKSSEKKIQRKNDTQNGITLKNVKHLNIFEN